MSFSIDVTNYAKKTKRSVDQTVRAIKISLFSAVIRDTRVDTGRLRGNWQTTTGRPASSAIDRLDKIPQGTNGGAAFDAVPGVVKGDTVDYLTNNLPYAEKWEDEDGMVAKNIANIKQIVREES